MTVALCPVFGLRQPFTERSRIGQLAKNAIGFDLDERNFFAFGAAFGCGGECFFELRERVGVLARIDILAPPFRGVITFAGAGRLNGEARTSDRQQNERNERELAEDS